MAAERQPVPVMPQRILMTADAVGGVWTYVMELARALSGRGAQIALATMGQPLSRSQREESAAIPHLTLHESEYRLEWMQDPWDDVERSGEWLLALAKEFQPDLVHLNGYAHGSLPWPCPCVIVAHSCVLSWWAAVRKSALPDCFDSYRERVAGGLKAATAVVAPTQTMLNCIRSTYETSTAGRVIYNARSHQLFAPGKKADFIFSVGRLWDDAKNIAALARVAGSLPWPVYAAGEEKHPDGASPRLEQLNRLGYLTPVKLASWFATAAIYAHPARYEPFGLTILEAAMSRCALVLGDIPSLRELWQDAAIFVPPDDSGALVRALQRLCADRSHREMMGESAFFRSQQFSVEAMAAGYCAAYAAATPVFRNYGA